jgi:signal transduction histidine kinase/ligand-binding sensor domain-containing protein
LVTYNQGYGLLNKNYILLFFLGAWFGVWCQPNTGQFINYGVKDGLSEAVCSGIAQDSRGFYWISTQGGINRFDGANFKSYFPSEMLGEKQLMDNSKVFFESVPNHLLVTLGNSEAFILNTISQELSPVKSLKNKNTMDFNRLDKNRILVSSIDTLFILNNRLEIIQAIIPPLKKKSFGFQLRMLSSSKCIINSTYERFLFDFKTKQFQTFQTQLPLDDLFNTGYDLLYVDPIHRRIYLTNYFRGLFQIDYQGKIKFSWSQGMLQEKMNILPNKMIQDNNNKDYVWVTGNSGISHLNLITRQATNYRHDPQIPFSIIDNQTSNLFIDQFQNLWVTTYKGLSTLNRNTTLIDDWDLKLSSDEPLMNMCRISQDELLATKYYDGVYQINEQNNKWSSYHKQELADSWFVFRDGSKLIHGGKGTGLKVIDLQSDKVAELSFLKDYFNGSELVSMGFRHSSGNWWFSGNSGGGLVCFDPKTKQITHFSKRKGSFSGSYFTNYSETPNGDLWFSSNKTQVLAHWIKKEDRFEEVDFGRIFKKEHQSIILDIATDQKGNVWIGFEGGGLVRYAIARKETTVFGKKEGIPSNYIYNLVFDDCGRLWVGTKKGLACLGTDLKTVQFFGAENGFPSEHFDQTSYFDEQTGMLWISCDNYLLRFFPDKLLQTEQLGLKIFIDEFLVTNRRQLLGNRMNYHFSPTQNTLQLSFSAINSLDESQIEYSYLLEGSSTSWVSLGTSSVVNFPSLPFGIYTFRLRAKNPGMKSWVYLKDPIRFEIATPWYRTWWFKTLLFLASAALIFFITRMYFLRKIEKQRAILEKQRAVQNERDRIAYDMHDDLGSGLTKISYLSKEALRKSENQGELNRINATSLELVKNMSELIWAMKVENDSLLDLLSYLRHYAMEYFDTNQIAIQMEMDELLEDEQISGEIRRQIFLVFKEALHNIVKHAQTKKVLIQIHLNEGQMRILVRDFGQGFQKDELGKSKSGNGMKTMQERIRKLNGTIRIKNKEDGVELIFEFPFRTI